MKTLQLPQMSTSRPSSDRKHNDNGECSNYLNRDFSQKAPNLVWVSDITYLRAGGRWYYLCIVMDLFSRKVISWQLSAKPDADLVMAAFRRAYEKRNAPYGLMFHSDRGAQYTAFSFRQLLDSLNVVQSFSKKGCPFDNACCECFFKYLKKKKPTGKYIIPLKNSGFPFSSTLKDTTTPNDHTEHLACSLLMKQKLYTGSRMLNLLLKTFILFCVHLLDYSSVMLPFFLNHYAIIHFFSLK